mgnify:FL=1
MRIGILTFHCAHNFGAVLQAFALQSQLQLMGYDVNIINYRPKYLDKGYPQLHYWMFTHGRAWNTIKRYFKLTRKEQKSYKKYMSFERKYMISTKRCETPDNLIDIINRFDYLILGSDQIWNEKFNGSETIWLGDIKSFKGKIITYAASAGNHEFSMDFREKLKKILPLYKSISVREPSLIPKLKELTNKNLDIKTVLDPTLMVNPAIWNQFKQRIYKKNYILCYQARKSEDTFRIAQKLSKQLKTDIVSVDLWNNSFRDGVKNIIIAPNEFISLVQHATCVITTPFHGTANSIICNTPFYALKLDDGADERIEYLLQLTGLKDRMIHKSSTPLFSTCNYKEVNNKLSNIRILSQEYLKDSLKE